MFSDKVKYEGLVSQGIDYHNGNIKIEQIRKYDASNGNKKLSLDYGYVMRKFFYDMKYIEDYLCEFNEVSQMCNFLSLEKEKLCLQIREKWEDIGKHSVFSSDLCIAKLYEEPLKKYFDDISFFEFSENYYLKGSLGFSTINLKPDIENQPSDEKYFKSLYELQKNRNLLKTLESAISEKESYLGEAPQLEKIFLVDDAKKHNPKIYELDIDSTLFQMKYLSETCDIDKIYFQFKDMILKKQNDECFAKWEVIFAEISSNSPFIQKGIFYMPNLNEKRLIEVKK